MQKSISARTRAKWPARSGSASTTTVVTAGFPGFRREFSGAYPNIELQLASAISEKPLQRLQQRGRPCADFSAGARTAGLYVSKMNWLQCSPPGIQWRAKIIFSRKISAAKCCSAAGLRPTLLYQRVLRPAGIRPRVVMQVNLTEKRLWNWLNMTLESRFSLGLVSRGTWKAVKFARFR